MDLKNKKILILGGTGSVGGAKADVLEREGAQVARHGFRSGDFRADLSRDGEAERLVGAVLEKFGTIDIVINAISAPLKLAPLEKKNWDDFMAQLGVQLRAAVEITNEVAPIMKKNGGGIILHIISSAVDEKEPPSHMADYVAAKYALLGFARASEKELARFGIKVLHINPKFIKNDFTREMPEKAVEIMDSKGEVSTLEGVAEGIIKILRLADSPPPLRKEE